MMLLLPTSKFLLSHPSRIFSSIVSAWLGQSQLPEWEQLVPQLVNSTSSVYTTITTELLPTPTKSHYTFNLRDLSKVFQGMLMAPPKRLKVGMASAGKHFQAAEFCMEFWDLKIGIH